MRIPQFSGYGVEADVLRLDKIHPVISGNKWFKLKHYLQGALEKQCQGILTFGGPYSNHIIAAACAAHAAGLQSIGIIRGERPKALSHSLREAQEFGMDLQFISREAYREKATTSFLDKISRANPGSLVIPEGGAGPDGIRGCEEILGLTDKQNYSHILCAVGTATLLLGLANASLPNQSIIGIPVLKGYDAFSPTDRDFLQNTEKAAHCHLIGDYHFGGYARKAGKLFAFMNEWYELTGIPSDFVYTAKLFFGGLDLVKKGYFPRGSRLLLVHSGGLQGNRSLEAGILRF